MSKYSDELRRYRKYKWEFLRRNTEYIETWEKLPENLRKEYKGYKKITRDLEDTEVEFILRWKIYDPIPPDVTSDEIAEVDKEINIFAEEGWSRGPVIVADAFQWEKAENGNQFVNKRLEKLADNGSFNIRVNLNYSKKRIIDEFTALIDVWMKRYEDSIKKNLEAEFCRKRGVETLSDDDELYPKFLDYYKNELQEIKTKFIGKYHFANFDIYLKVYDMHEQGISWREIAETLDLYDKDRARNHYKSARNLIEKGVHRYAI